MSGTRALGKEAEEYLSWLAVERGRAPNTLAAYRRDLAAYETFLAERGEPVADAGPDAVVAYLRHLQASGRAPASVGRAMVAVRGLHRFCLDEGRAESDPTTDIGLPKVPLGLPKALGEDEVASLLDGVAGTDPVGRRDRAILEVLYGGGLRISELVGLSLSDLALDEGLLKVVGKGQKERLVPLGRMALSSLSGWLSPGGRGALRPVRWARRGDAEAVFLNVRGGRLTRQGAWAIVGRHGERAGLSGRLWPHVLRHSCATHMLDHGADLRVVQELLGHASIATTQVYTRVSAERLRQAYLEAHPRARGGPWPGASRPEGGRAAGEGLCALGHP
ncbi:MAG: tyrosine recombinase XerD [Acidimicrobiales bacterium]|nr:tyrosine recombinase XerD [Acidimicrobiales bacterium]